MSDEIDREERELLDSYNNDEWVSIVDKDEIERYRVAARNTLKESDWLDVHGAQPAEKP